MKRTVIRVLVVMITLAWMLVIFGFSSQSGEESGGLSAAIAGPVTKWLAGLQRGLTTEAEAALFTRVDGVVRMVAHFFEYAVLGGLLTLLSQLLSKKTFWLPVAVGMLYALTDEWHQSFSPGRVCDFNDVVIDSLGVLIGILLCNKLIQIWRKKHVYHS